MKQSTLIFLLLTLSRPTWALYSTMTTGDLLGINQYKVQVESQALTTDDQGLNLLGRFEMNLREDANLVATLGFGTTDFQSEVYYKWVPFPDLEDQPAIGLMGGFNVARYEEIDEFGARIHPFISKRFDSNVGEFNPYTSLPIGFANRDGDLQVPIQLAIGTQFLSNKIDWGRFYVEMGFDLHEAFSYISASIEFLLAPHGD